MKSPVLIFLSLLLCLTVYADQPISPSITNAITVTNVKVLGEAPAMSIGNIYQVQSTWHDTSGNCQLTNARNTATEVASDSAGVVKILQQGEQMTLPCRDLPLSASGIAASGLSFHDAKPNNNRSSASIQLEVNKAERVAQIRDTN